MSVATVLAAHSDDPAMSLILFRLTWLCLDIAFSPLVLLPEVRLALKIGRSASKAATTAMP